MSDPSHPTHTSWWVFSENSKIVTKWLFKAGWNSLFMRWFGEHGSPLWNPKINDVCKTTTFGGKKTNEKTQVMKFCTGDCGEHIKAKERLWIGFQGKLKSEVDTFLRDPTSKPEITALHLCALKAILGGSSKYLDSDGEERTCLWKLFDDAHDIRKELDSYITPADRQWAMNSLIQLSKLRPKLVYSSLTYQEKQLKPKEVHQRLSMMEEQVGKQTVAEFLYLVEALKETGNRFVYLNATFFGG